MTTTAASTPLTFSLPKSASALKSASDADLASAREIIASLESLASSSTSPAPLDVLRKIDDFHALQFSNNSKTGLLRNVHPDKETRDVASDAQQEWSKIGVELQQNAKVYQLLTAVNQAGQEAGLDKETTRWVKHMLRDYRREGIDRDEATRARVKALKDEINKTDQAFSDVINADTRTAHFEPKVLDGMPDDFVQAHQPGADGKVAITTNYPDYFPFMTYCRDEAARRVMAFTSRQKGYPANGKNMLKLFQKRQELAALLGYKSYADYQLEVEMVGSGQNVLDFVNKIDGLAKDRSARDKAELLRLKQELDPSADAVYLWDDQFLQSELKKTKYALDNQALRQYFPFGRCRDGVLAACERLFAVRFERVDAEVWHPDVRAYHMYDAATDVLAGRFYLDLHPRENKYKHAAEFDICQGTPRQLPEAALVCNFPPGDESLMEHSEVTTFFHEFGHLLHHLVAKNKWTALAGITCNWDFVEAPSQMLEEWTFDYETLRRFAINAVGEPIPEDMVAALKRARGQNRGSFCRTQMMYAMNALTYHLPDARLESEDDIDRIPQDLSKTYGPYPHIPDSHFVYAFGHLGGYASAYYTYMWSQVIAQDMFTRFEPAMYDPHVAAEYKTKVLARGGAEDADTFIQDFLGRPYAFDSFSRYLAEGEA